MDLLTQPAEYGIQAYLNNADLQDMVEEEIFVSSPVKTQQRRQIIEKQDFAQPEQLKFCLPAPGLFESQQPPPLKIVNSETLAKLQKKKKGKGKKAGTTSKAIHSWQHPRFLKTQPRPRSSFKADAWDSTTQPTKTFDEMKRNVLEQQVLREQQKQSQNKRSTSVAGLRVEKAPMSTQIHFEGKRSDKALEIVHDVRFLQNQSRSPKKLAQERKELEKEAQRRKKVESIKKALVELEEVGLSGGEKQAKKDIMIARPQTAGPLREFPELDVELLRLSEEKLGQLKAGVDLNLQAKDSIIQELKQQYELLLEQRKEMNSEFQSQVVQLQEEKNKLKALALARVANPLKKTAKKGQGTAKTEQEGDENVPTRDPGLRTTKNSTLLSARPLKSAKAPRTPSRKKLTTTLESRPQSRKKTGRKEEVKAPEAHLEEAMIKHQIERQVALDYEKQVTEKILTSIRSNPNTELQLMQREVDALTEKLAPVMQRVQATVATMNEVNYVRQKGEAVGMVSRIAGKFMAFHADKIVDLMLDELMEDTAEELQSIEAQMRESLEDEEGKEVAQKLLEVIEDFQDQAERLEFKVQSGNLHKELRERTKKKQRKLEFNLEADESRSYQHPFQLPSTALKSEDSRSLGREFLEMEFDSVGPIEYEQIIRQRRVSELPVERLRSIEEGMGRFSEYVRRVNGSDNPEVWKLYDHLTNEYFSELFAGVVREAQSEIEGGLEQIILDELLATQKK